MCQWPGTGGHFLNLFPPLEHQCREDLVTFILLFDWSAPQEIFGKIE